MALDGIFLSLIIKEIEPLCGVARVDRVHQPSRDTLVISLRVPGGSKKLLLSASSQTPRVHLTLESAQNPPAPPMFCMLMRKHLGGAKLLSASQQSLDRVANFSFECKNELGDTVILTLVAEIMGRHSNVILVGQDGSIIDSIKRVAPSQSSVRQVLPGIPYTLPPGQDKVNILIEGAAAAYDRVLSYPELPLERALINSLEGISPVVARELAGSVTSSLKTVGELSDEHLTRLMFFLKELALGVEAGGTPTMLCQRDGSPKDISFLPLRQYEGLMLTKTYDSYWELLDAFYSERCLKERIKQRSGDLFRHVANLSERMERKMQAQREELLKSKAREELRVKADILNANLYRLKKGDSIALLENFYAENSPQVEIPLDIRLTPAQNAQHYYLEYRKLSTAERILTEQLKRAEDDYSYLDTVLDSLMRATTSQELDSVRAELVLSGFLRREGGGKKEGKPVSLPPVSYRSSDGFLIMQGRSNLQNDKLTMKDSRKDDIWFHTQNIPGSHVVIVTEGREPPAKTLEEAATIAAANSKAKNSSLVPVDYTAVKNVRKPAGARPGFVLYVNYKTAIVNPDFDLLEKLRVK